MRSIAGILAGVFAEGDGSRHDRGLSGKGRRTFYELPSVDLARGDLEGNDMVLEASNVSLRASNAFRNSNLITCASFSSFIGIPIVLVMAVSDAQAAQKQGESESAPRR